jgi:hypothetical protein
LYLWAGVRNLNFWQGLVISSWKTNKRLKSRKVVSCL